MRIVKIIGLGLILAASPALACTPCPDMRSLSETIDRADLVIVGRAVSSSPEGNLRRHDKYTRIRVETVLKGEVEQRTIKVLSWYGMCPYGLFMVEGERAIIYLIRDGDRFEIDGCGEGRDLILDGKVQIGDQALTLDEYRRTYLSGQ